MNNYFICRYYFENNPGIDFYSGLFFLLIYLDDNVKYVHKFNIKSI
jgi:hypothetical protein